MSASTLLPQPETPPEAGRAALRRRLLDVLWLFFLGGLALLPPIAEIHKQLLLAGIAVVQLGEGRLLAWNRNRGRLVAVGAKLLFAALLLGHTGGLGIASSYYPIFYVPVITAAMYYGLWGTLVWTSTASAAYLAYLVPALKEYSLTREGATELAIRILFFYLAALIVNRIVNETRRQRDLYQRTAAVLEVRNRELMQAKAEAQRAERLAALGQMSAGLAHEIRNPLSVIKGAAEILRQKLDAANPLAAEMAGYISSEVNRLNALVARFLDFARPVALTARSQPVIPVLERGLRAVAERWPEAKVRVERDYAPDLPPVAIDEALCEQVFINLATNAYEAMNFEGVLRVSAQPARREQAAGVQIRFEDSGPGVPAELSEQIFNPFVTTKETGVGLGLSLVSKIVDEHRGALQLCPSPIGGACFQLFLPTEAHELASGGSGA